MRDTFPADILETLDRYAAYYGRAWIRTLTCEHMPRATYGAFTGADAGRLQCLRNLPAFNYAETLRTFEPSPVVCEETGPDWSPTPARKFYAQHGAGRHAFGATAKKAREALQRELARDASRDPMPYGSTWED